MIYKIVSEQTVPRLEEEVNELISQGWELQGGMSASINESTDYYYSKYSQAMILKDHVKR